MEKRRAVLEKRSTAFEKIASIMFILGSGGFVIYALIDGNLTGILTTTTLFLLVLLIQAFVLVPRFRRWNRRG